MKFSFKPVTAADKDLILDWLHTPHVGKWFHGIGLQNTIEGLNNFINNNKPNAQSWLAYKNSIPFAYLITSNVALDHTYDSNKTYAKWANSDTKMITLDMLIGDVNFLGKGYAVPLIKTFLQKQFSENTTVFLDPECSNKRAIHVYMKAGFIEVDQFIASWNPVPHLLMLYNIYSLQG